MTTGIRSSQSNPTIQLNNLSISSGSSSSSSSSSFAPVIPELNRSSPRLSNADTEQLTQPALVNFPGADAAAQVLAHNQATVALYRRLTSENPPGLPEGEPYHFRLKNALQPLQGVSLAEQAAYAREQLSKLTTDDIKLVDAIELGNAGLTCAPKELSLFQPRALNLSNNNFTSFPTGLPRTIKCLNISHNQISSSEEPFDVPPSTVYLFLSHNNLTSFPKMTWEQTNLRGPETGFLDLSFNQISSLPEDMSHLNHLESIILSYNNVTELPAQMVLPKCLRQLILPFNKVASLPSNMSRFYEGGGKFFINLTENPIENTNGVNVGEKLLISIGFQWAYEEDSYLYMGEYGPPIHSFFLNPEGPLENLKEAPKLLRITPGPYRGVNLIEADHPSRRRLEGELRPIERVSQ